VSSRDATFLGLRFAEDARRAVLPVTARLCTPFGFLYGGSSIAACATAAEAVTGRPLVWVTTQFVGNAFAGEEIELEVDELVAARATSQAAVRGHVGGRVVFTAVTAHTDRPPGDAMWWGEMPAVPGPEACEPFVFPHAPRLETTFMEFLERRVPTDWRERASTGRVPMWVRVPGYPIGSGASQSFVADIVPMAVATALGRDPGATSLDNTVRVVHEEPTEDWVLLDVEAQGFRRSVGHGQVRLWSRAGVLLGIGSQTCIIRTSHHDRPA